MRLKDANGDIKRCYKCGQSGHEQSQCVKRPMLDNTTYAKSMRNPKKPAPEEPASKKKPKIHYDEKGNEIKVADLLIKYERPVNTNYDPDKNKNVECYNCKQLGHYKNECPLPDRRFERDLPNIPVNSTQDRRFMNPFQSKESLLAGGVKRMMNIGGSSAADSMISAQAEANKRAKRE